MGTDIIYQQVDYLEEEELEIYRAKVRKTIFEIFKKLGDIRFNIQNEVTGCIHRFYVLVHVDSAAGFTYLFENPCQEEVNILQILEKKNISISNQAEPKKEQFKWSKDNNMCEIADDEDDDVVMIVDDAQKAKKPPADSTKPITSVNIQDDDDDVMIIESIPLEHTS